MKELNTITVDGKQYKHISTFSTVRNTIKQRIFQLIKKGEQFDAIKLTGGYYLPIESELTK